MVSRVAVENVERTGESWIDTCLSRLVHRPPLYKSVVTIFSSEVAANIPKLNGIATNDNEVRRLAAIIEDRNRSIVY